MTVAVAMATHGRTGLTRLLMGSVTAAVAHRIPVPLLVVRHGTGASWEVPLESAVVAPYIRRSPGGST